MGLLQALQLPPLPGRQDTADDAKAAGGQRSASLGGGPPPLQVAGLGSGAPSGAPGRARSGSVGGSASPTPPTGKGAASPEQAVYDAARSDVEQLVAALDAHPMRAKINDAMNGIATQLQTAAGHAAKAEWQAATKALNEARASCAKAKTLADDWQTYLKKFARGREQQQAWAGWNDTRVADAQTRLDKAKNLAEGSPPKLPEAVVELDTLDGEMMAGYRSTLQSVRDRVTNIEAQGDAVKTFLAKPLGDGRALITRAESALAKGEFSQALLSRRNAYDILATTEHHAELRKAYETQRATTMTDIAGVKALPAMADRGPWLDGVVARADALASYAQLKIREGQQLLVGTSANCSTFTQAEPTAASYNAERGLADGEINALDASAGAPGVTEQRKAIRSLLGTAATSAAAARANNADPAPSWLAALEAVKRARADLVVAAKLATDMGAALGAQQAAAGGAGADPAAMKTALATLRADLAKARSAAHADIAEKALKRCGNQADEASQALDKQKTKEAARHLKEAGEALAEARDAGPTRPVRRRPGRRRATSAGAAAEPARERDQGAHPGRRAGTEGGAQGRQAPRGHRRDGWPARRDRRRRRGGAGRQGAARVRQGREGRRGPHRRRDRRQEAREGAAEDARGGHRHRRRPGLRRRSDRAEEDHDQPRR